MAAVSPAEIPTASRAPLRRSTTAVRPSPPSNSNSAPLSPYTTIDDSLSLGVNTILGTPDGLRRTSCSEMSILILAAAVDERGRIPAATRLCSFKFTSHWILTPVSLVPRWACTCPRTAITALLTQYASWILVVLLCRTSFRESARRARFWGGGGARPRAIRAVGSEHRDIARKDHWRRWRCSSRYWWTSRWNIVWDEYGGPILAGRMETGDFMPAGRWPHRRITRKSWFGPLGIAASRNPRGRECVRI